MLPIEEHRHCARRLSLIQLRRLFVPVVTLFLHAHAVNAQQTNVFSGRLSPVPVTAATAPTTLGRGTVTATLDGNVLTIDGSFEGMNSPATIAHIHRALKGLRGPAVHELTATKSSEGTVRGRLRLTAEQIEDLKKGWYYVQIHTERNPEGHLRGWLSN